MVPDRYLPTSPGGESTTPVHSVPNLTEATDWSYLPCCFMQLGLAVALLDIWNRMVQGNIPAAYVFEDDVLFHDQFEILFPTVRNN